jgi:D-glycero-alpha-D-manno-heptose-7-phosphate kinase
MIMSRAPLRVSFVGGGSDLPSFYQENKNGGAVISLAVNRYVYVTINNSFNSYFRIAYSKLEYSEDVHDIEHPIVRNTLLHFNIKKPLEITTVADVPSGTGLGSSSSFTVALIKALDEHFGFGLTQYEIAEAACHIEITMCGEPIGKQDQFAAAFGGAKVYEFNSDQTTRVNNVKISKEALISLEEKIELFYLGEQRLASNILENQNNRAQSNFKALVEMRNCALQFGLFLEKGDFSNLGKILNDNWKLKKSLSSGISTPKIDDLIKESLLSGAYGAKLLGAGGTGFIMTLRKTSVASKVKKVFKLYKSLGPLKISAGAEILYNG